MFLSMCAIAEIYGAALYLLSRCGTHSYGTPILYLRENFQQQKNKKQIILCIDFDSR